MKKKDILFLCQFFYPEYNSSATLPFDTACYLCANGFQVGAMCGYPKEYSDQKRVPLKETVNGVSIKRLRYIQLKRSKRLGRLINYFSFTFSAFLHLFELRKYKSVIVYSNPPVLPIIAILANILFHTKIVFVAYDVYPEIAYASDSILKGSIIDRLMKRVNRSMYRRTSAVVALSEEMRQFLIKEREGQDASTVKVIPNWAHENSLAPSVNAYEKFGYREDQLIVSYFGNMGICQDVETMLESMKSLKNNDKIQFLIVGHGNKKSYVEEVTKDFSNVKVLDFLTGEDFEKAIAITDCGIVSLEKGLKGMCAPSKYYSYLQGGCAVISIAETDSFISEEAEEKKIGFSVALGDNMTLTDQLKKLSDNRELCTSMKLRAKALYDSTYAQSIAMKKYEKMFSEVLEK